MLPQEFSDENHARLEICRVGKGLFKRGYVHASAGNISVRLADGFLITPTDACLGFLEPAQLARTDSAGEQLSGARASKTLALHRAIYASDAQARCVIHTHSTHLVALSLQAGLHGEPLENSELLPPITPYFVMKVGHVPHIAYHRPGDPAVAVRVAQSIAAYEARGTPIRAVMLERLGPNVWHNSPAEAMATLEELEETAKLSLLNHGKAPALTEAQLHELRATFGVRW